MTDNWYPDGDPGREATVTRTRASPSWPRAASQAFFEHFPIRATPQERPARLPLDPLRSLGRDLRPRHADLPRARTRRTASPSPRPATVLLGEAQRAWLKSALEPRAPPGRSIASDMPLGLVVRGRTGRLRGRLQRRQRRPPRPRAGDRRPPRVPQAERVRNVVWITGDVHYCGRPPLRSRARPLHRLRSLLGVRGRPPARGHVRAGRPRPDLRAGGRASSASPRHEAEPAALRRLPVLRDAAGRRPDAGPDRAAPRPQRARRSTPSTCRRSAEARPGPGGRG